MIGPLFVVARLTAWETVRRRLMIALVVMTLIIIATTGWGYNRLWTATDNGAPIGVVQVRAITSQVLILMYFVFAGVLALSSVLIAASSISGDIESGLALSILSRPIGRAQWALGKWLGLAAMTIAYAGGAGWLELLVADFTTGYLPPHPWQLVGYIGAEGLILLTLALTLSTRMAGMTAGIIALVGYFMAWVGGIVSGIGLALNNAPLTELGVISRLLLPTDGLWRGAVWTLEPASLLTLGRQAGRAAAAADPFMVAEPASPLFLLWALVWIGVVLLIAIWSLRSREL